jgi:hypothetical protein
VSLTGTIGSLTGTCPVLSFVADGRRVVTDPTTRFNGGNCRDLANGRGVEVDGEVQVGGIVLASRVIIRGR